jgi:hypothetical protein
MNTEEDLDRLRVLLQDPTLSDNAELRERAAVLMRKLLNGDSENEDALSPVDKMEGPESPVPPPMDPSEKLSIPEPKNGGVKRTRLSSVIVLGLVALALTAGIAQFVTGGLQKTDAQPAQPRPAQVIQTPEQSLPPPIPESNVQPTMPVAPVAAPASNVLNRRVAVSLTSAAETTQTLTPVQLGVDDTGLDSSAGDPILPGRLSVNSSVPVDIYDGESFVGSTPMTLRLSPGTHTFEYRYQNLVKELSHVITSNETTSVSVSFDTTVRINAMPWAEVFIEGREMRSLGQTPLSNVSVALGSVLVFRHPRFPEKKHRVTAADSAIQVVFR